MTQVPFVDLRAQAQEFETAFAAYCETVHCSGVSSGSDAVKLALLGTGVSHGDEVIVPVNTFIAIRRSHSRQDEDRVTATWTSLR